jgi:uncharacterized membrane-anchored protein YitT (DUF2179 family)
MADRRIDMKQRAMRLDLADKRVFYLMMAMLITAVVTLSLISAFLLPDDLYSAGAGTLSAIEMRLVGNAAQTADPANGAVETLRLVDLLSR